MGSCDDLFPVLLEYLCPKEAPQYWLVGWVSSKAIGANAGLSHDVIKSSLKDLSITAATIFGGEEKGSITGSSNQGTVSGLGKQQCLISSFLRYSSTFPILISSQRSPDIENMVSLLSSKGRATLARILHHHSKSSDSGMTFNADDMKIVSQVASNLDQLADDNTPVTTENAE